MPRGSAPRVHVLEADDDRDDFPGYSDDDDGGAQGGGGCVPLPVDA